MGLTQEHNLDGTLHGTDAQLELYALGRLPASDLPLLEEHLLTCTACQERLDGIEDVAIGMREALAAWRQSRPRRPQTDWLRWLRRPAFSMALAFAALVVVLAIFSNGRDPVRAGSIASVDRDARRNALRSARSRVRPHPCGRSPGRGAIPDRSRECSGPPNVERAGGQRSGGSPGCCDAAAVDARRLLRAALLSRREGSARIRIPDPAPEYLFEPASVPLTVGHSWLLWSALP